MKLTEENLRFCPSPEEGRLESLVELQVEALAQVLRETCPDPAAQMAVWDQWIAQVRQWEP